MTTLLQLRAGERFLLNNKPYIRSDSIGSDVSVDGKPVLQVYAVGLYSGELVMLNLNVEVKKVN